MKKAIQLMKTSFENNGLIPMFEFEVIDNKTKEVDYITFDISIQKNSFVAQHVALTAKEERSIKVSYKSIEIDTDFSIDENLQELWQECNTAIYDSEFYTPID